MMKSYVVPVKNAAYPVVTEAIMEQRLAARYDQMWYRPRLEQTAEAPIGTIAQTRPSTGTLPAHWAIAYQSDGLQRF